MKLSKLVIVAGEACLAEAVAAKFRRAGTYLVVIEAPPHRLANLNVFSNDCVRIANIINAIQPQYLAFVACNETVIREITLHVHEVLTKIEIEDFDESRMASLPGFRQREMTASRWGQTMSNVHVIVVEDGQPMAKVIAENLAVAESASLLVVPHVPNETVKNASDYLRDWAELSGIDREDAKNNLIGLISRLVEPLTTTEPRSVSFITSGIPYGIYPFRCATTHLFVGHSLGIGIVNGILKSLAGRVRCPVAVLIDPGFAERSEFDALRRTFGERKYLLRRAFKETASVTQCRYLTEHLPCDYLFYSTHCVEKRGRRITEAFATDDGKQHQITYDVIRTANASPTPGIIETNSFHRFLALDGVQWTDSAGKKRIGAGRILDEFLRMPHGGDPRQMRIIESVESPAIRASDSLEMHDGPYIPIPQNLGGCHMPVVFNNACSSWRELARRFAYNASAYIGTSLDVLNSVAVQIVKDFGRRVANGDVVGPALYRAQSRFGRDNGYTPYLMHGYLFTRLRPPPAGLIVKRLVRRKLQTALEAACSARDDNQEHERAWNSVIEFLSSELEALEKSLALEIRPAH